jgi:hypothetical protein
LLRSVFLQSADHVGDVRQLLFEVALILLEPPQPLLAVAETSEAVPPGVPRGVLTV